MIHIKYIVFLLIVVLSACDSRMDWEKRYDDSIDFVKSEEIKKISTLEIINAMPNNSSEKPRGKFFAFEKRCSDCEIESSGDINLHLEKDNMLGFEKQNLAAFVLYVIDRYKERNVETGRIIFIDAKTYNPLFVIPIEGTNEITRRTGRRKMLTTSSSVGPLPIVNAIKE